MNNEELLNLYLERIRLMSIEEMNKKEISVLNLLGNNSPSPWGVTL